MRTLQTIIILSLAILFTLTSCKTNDRSKDSSNDKSEDFDWLLGKWKRTNDKAGNQTFEFWEKISNSEYAGIGFTMYNGDTINQELITLIQQDGNWSFIVSLPQNAESVVFGVTELAFKKFTCENPTHDFPTTIQYWMENDSFKALVSGGDTEIPFEFEKIDLR